MASKQYPSKMRKSDANPSKGLSLPHSIEAEQAVIGMVLREPVLFQEVIQLLKPEYFFSDLVRSLFEAAVLLDKDNAPLDIFSILDKIRYVEGAPATSPSDLISLLEKSPVSQNLHYYAQVITDHFFLRKVILTCSDTISRATKFEGKVHEFVEDIEKEFLEISSDQQTKGIRMGKDVLMDTLEDLEQKIQNQDKVSGVPSGFYDLDGVTGGWQPSDLIILAARPGMGKTALALNFATHAAKSKLPVIVFSLEMAQTQLMMRVLSSESRVDSSKFRKGDLTEDEQDRLVHGAREVSEFSQYLGIDETPGISLLELRSRARRFKKEHGLGLIIIDYLQLMTVGGSQKVDSREREISEISMGLKSLAKELHVPVIALAQLNRGPDSRPDKRPKLSDLRESGSMEQDADQILFVYRDEYYNKNSEAAGKAEVILGKNRHGQQETVLLAYLPNFVSFHNLLAD